MSKQHQQQPPMLSFPYKFTEEVDFVSAIRNHANIAFSQSSDPDSHPDALVPEANKLQDLRKEATFTSSASRGVPASSSSSSSATSSTTTSSFQPNMLAKMVLYHAQLVFMLSKFPVDISLFFPWYPLFTTPPAQHHQDDFSLPGNLPQTTANELSDLQYERASVLINIAATYARMATMEDRTNAEGIKKAIAHFSNAAGILGFVMDTVLPLIQLAAEDHDPPSPDLSRSTLSALRSFCLAQAQECVFQRALADNLKNGSVARIAQKTADLFSEAFEMANEARGAGGVWPTFVFPPEWLNHVSYKLHHFAAVAQYRKSKDDSSSNRYGDELGRLHLAQKHIKDGLATSKKGVSSSVVIDIKSLQIMVQELVKTAERDNRLIYLQAITSESDLPPINAMTMVKPTIPQEIEFPIPRLHAGAGGLGMRPLFERLVPYAVHLAISLYDDRKDNYIREQIVTRKDDLDQISTSTLQSLGLPGSIQALEVPDGVPVSLLRRAEELRSEGGTKRLRTTMQDALSVASTDRKVLDDVSALLDAEEQEDAQLRAHFGGDRWTRPTSETLNNQLRLKISKFSDTLTAASESDKVVRSKFSEWEGTLQLMEGDERALEASIPSQNSRHSSYDEITSPSSQTALVRELRHMLEDLDDLIAARRRTVEDAKRAAHNDDIRPLVLRKTAEITSKSSDKVETAMFEDLFRQELQKYGFYRDTLSGNERKQQVLLDRIAATNEKFISARQNDSIARQREEALQKFEIAFSKHQEIALNLSEALQFYQDFAKLLDQLRATVREWVQARRMEAQVLMNTLNMENVEVQDHRHDGRESLASPRAQQDSRTNTPGQPRRLRVQEAGVWQPGMPVKFG